MGKIGSNNNQLFQNVEMKKSPKNVEAAQQSMQKMTVESDQNSLKEKLSGFLDKNTAESISKAKMEPNSIDFKTPDKQHIRALKDALKSLNKIPDDKLQEMNLGKMKNKIQETLGQLQQGNLSETTVNKLQAQLQNLTDGKGMSEIRKNVMGALDQLQNMLNKQEPPKLPEHMRPNKIDPDANHIMKYASVFAK